MFNDTACPVQIRNFPMQNQPKKRFPDAIGFGFAKCGTGRDGLNQKFHKIFLILISKLHMINRFWTGFSLAFLDCHPNIVFRKNEPGVTGGFGMVDLKK